MRKRKTKAVQIRLPKSERTETWSGSVEGKGTSTHQNYNSKWGSSSSNHKDKNSSKDDVIDGFWKEVVEPDISITDIVPVSNSSEAQRFIYNLLEDKYK